VLRRVAWRRDDLFPFSKAFPCSLGSHGPVCLTLGCPGVRSFLLCSCGKYKFDLLIGIARLCCFLVLCSTGPISLLHQLNCLLAHVRIRVVARMPHYQHCVVGHVASETFQFRDCIPRAFRSFCTDLPWASATHLIGILMRIPLKQHPTAYLSNPGQRRSPTVSTATFKG
jgi:hypothetical protein